MSLHRRPETVFRFVILAFTLFSGLFFIDRVAGVYGEVAGPGAPQLAARR